ncbi:MAG TPA: hypothetical protein DEB09_03875 [Candidatus Magasanikbacteria bacterium]|nr:hypothetical protein [Candidatus Magasanikbacteria bacterium]
MQIPFRKPGKYMLTKEDPCITQKKIDELTTKLAKLKASCPAQIEEVRRLSLTGDFSENHAYQMAKGKLRGMNQRILELEHTLKNAQIIKPNKNNNTVQIGHIVTLEHDDSVKSYQILGSAETNPSKGTISYQSPLGSAMMNKKVGDIIQVKLADKIVEYKIVMIE